MNNRIGVLPHKQESSYSFFQRWLNSLSPEELDALEYASLSPEQQALEYEYADEYFSKSNIKTEPQTVNWQKEGF